jgi:AsmA protein
MRRFLTITLGILGVLLVILVALPFIIPVESYRGPIANAATQATGREVRIDGPLSLTIFPELGISVGDVSVANVAGAREPEMVSVGSLVVGVRFMPLLSGNVEVVRLVLEEPEIHLQVSADGTPNWAFASEAVPEAEPAVEPAAGGGSPINEISVEELYISGGQVTYFDQTSGTDIALQDVDITLSMPTAESALTMEGALTYNGQRFEMDTNIGRPRAFLSAESTPATISIVSNLFDADFDGILSATGQTTGNVNLSIESLRELSAWGGTPLPPGDNFGTTELQAAVESGPNRTSFSGLRMTMDGMTMTGDLAIDTSAAKPSLVGGLAIDRLNINNYLTASGGGAAAGGGGGAGGDAPLQLDILNAANANLTLSVGELIFQNLVFQQAAMGAQLDNGLLTSELREIALYGGSGRGSLTINAREVTPSFRHTLNVSGVDVQSFLTAFMEMDRISGTGTFNLDLATRGNSQNEIMNALSGTGNIDFANGALRGVDLAAIARTLENVVNQGGLGALTGGNATTEFTSFGGSFVVQNGIARNNDFQMVSPVVQILGNGEINLAAQTMDFNVEPRPVATGTVGGVDLANVGVPFRIHGPWNNLSYTPDLSGVARGVIENVLGGGNQGGGLGGGLGGALGGLLGGNRNNQNAEQQQQPQEGQKPEQQQQPAPQSPEDALRNLFGGFGGN